MKNKIFKFNFFFFLTFFAFSNTFAEKLRIGTLQYGSVNWELDLIKSLELDKKII